MSALPTMKNAQAILAAAQDKVEKLKSIDPYLIDLSLRENPVGARLGQTLADKLSIFPKLKEFGFKNIHLGVLDYSLPNELEVEDDFMMYLRDHQIDMTGCFASTALGISKSPDQFIPDPSQIKLQEYGVPNTLHEIYLSRVEMKPLYDPETLRRSLPASIKWLNDNIHGDKDGNNEGKPRIIINIVDGIDALFEDLETTCSILSLLAEQPIEGISVEDGRGTYLPFQVGAAVAVMRQFLPAPLKLLVHVHSGSGFENASVVEALLNGADGIWGALPKRAAMIGHASLGELIANLARVGNPYMQNYRLDQLLPLATWLQVLDEDELVPDDIPILGNNAYRLTMNFFEQQEGRFMDLPPEAIGGTYRYRINPLLSDQPIMAGRLAEITGRKPEEFSASVLEQMVRLVRRDLRAGKRIVYDEPENLLELYARASISS